MLNGKLIIYDKSWGSLACNGTFYITDGIITEINFSGYPRTVGDEWVSYFNQFKRGDKIKSMDYLLSFNGRYNIVCRFIESK